MVLAVTRSLLGTICSAPAPEVDAAVADTALADTVICITSCSYNLVIHVMVSFTLDVNNGYRAQSRSSRCRLYWTVTTYFSLRRRCVPP